MQTTRFQTAIATACSLFAALLCCDTASADEPPLSADELFAPYHLVEVKISVAEDDWDTLRVQGRSLTEALSRELQDSPYTYVKADVTIDGVLVEDVGIRKKGFLGSLDEHRPSLKLKFDKYRKQSPVAGLDRLTLNNNKQDSSRLSQYLGYRFFNASGTFASRCNLAKVTVNGEYLGIYSNVESIKTPMLKRGFGDGSGALYEGTITDFYPDYVGKFERKNSAAKRKPIETVAEAMTGDEPDLKTLRSIIDLDAFVKYWATESLLGFWDGYTNDQNNFFVYQSPANAKLYFIPWGADALFTEYMPLPPYLIQPQFVYNRALLPNKLYRTPEVQQLYHKTVAELLDTHWNEKELVAEVDRMEALLKDHIRKDNPKFKGAVNSIRNFVNARRERLNAEMKNGPVELKSAARRPAYFKEVGRVVASFETMWYDATPANTKKLGKAQLVLELDGERVELSEVSVYAEHAKWPPVPAGKAKPPAIVFLGTRKSNGHNIIVGTGLSIEKFHPTKQKPVEIGGMIIDGIFGAPGTKTIMLGGTVTFEEAEMKDGAKIKGRMELTASELSDGEPKL